MNYHLYIPLETELEIVTGIYNISYVQINYYYYC